MGVAQQARSPEQFSIEELSTVVPGAGPDVEHDRVVPWHVDRDARGVAAISNNVATVTRRRTTHAKEPDGELVVSAHVRLVIRIGPDERKATRASRVRCCRAFGLTGVVCHTAGIERDDVHSPAIAAAITAAAAAAPEPDLGALMTSSAVSMAPSTPRIALPVDVSHVTHAKRGSTFAPQTDAQRDSHRLLAQLPDVLRIDRARANARHRVGLLARHFRLQLDAVGSDPRANRRTHRRRNYLVPSPDVLEPFLRDHLQCFAQREQMTHWRGTGVALVVGVAVPSSGPVPVIGAQIRNLVGR